MSREPLLFAYYDGVVVTFERVNSRTGSVFGGPPRYRVDGLPHGPRPLHHIATLHQDALPPLKKAFLLDLPLHFGLAYSGCDLVYDIGFGDIHLSYLEPAVSTSDWPYPDYPNYLPYFPLRKAGPPRPSSWSEFAGRFINMPANPRASLVIAVPDPVTIGHSLWGPHASSVTIVFECDLARRRVQAVAVGD